MHGLQPMVAHRRAQCPAASPSRNCPCLAKRGKGARQGELPAPVHRRRVACRVLSMLGRVNVWCVTKLGALPCCCSSEASTVSEREVVRRAWTSSAQCQQKVTSGSWMGSPLREKHKIYVVALQGSNRCSPVASSTVWSPRHGSATRLVALAYRGPTSNLATT